MNEDKKKAIQLLKTARGQIDGIIKMIENERYCIDVSNQIMASQALVKKANKHILSQHLNSCVIAAMDNKESKEEKIQELDKIISKLLESK
ncbi:metal-sensing transcriptional repressor [uncultured Clostridium sp.]|jgi:DNA-binding FrmR family transcriptional regulator|uniref:metal-sensing transcriptional repressor n=1 Tax=uncultured Clostridium sp. TaxID=59620 RepID=UPI002630AF43|nr:metal-sensing transcriptional repressor [uncultured Clostridium sp.]